MADVSVPDALTARRVPPVVERTLRLLPLLLYMAFTWSASARPADALPSAIDDRLAHFGEYGLLALLALFAITAFDARRVRGGALAAAAAIAIAWGVVDELHQSFVPTRDSSLSDLLFDALGTAAALGMAAVLARAERRRA
ncbi:MAG: VanZ family protein [Thermoanaerobaculia bacterium]